MSDTTNLLQNYSQDQSRYGKSAQEEPWFGGFMTFSLFILALLHFASLS